MRIHDSNTLFGLRKTHIICARTNAPLTMSTDICHGAVTNIISNTIPMNIQPTVLFSMWSRSELAIATRSTLSQYTGVYHPHGGPGVLYMYIAERLNLQIGYGTKVVVH